MTASEYLRSFWNSTPEVKAAGAVWDAATETFMDAEDYAYRAWNGSLSPHDLSEVSGGDPVASDFAGKYWPARSVPGALFDVVTGDPLGMDRAPDGGNGSPDFTWAVVLALGLVGLLVLVVLFRK